MVKSREGIEKSIYKLKLNFFKYVQIEFIVYPLYKGTSCYKKFVDILNKFITAKDIKIINFILKI